MSSLDGVSVPRCSLGVVAAAASGVVELGAVSRVLQVLGRHRATILHEVGASSLTVVPTGSTAGSSGADDAGDVVPIGDAQVRVTLLAIGARERRERPAARESRSKAAGLTTPEDLLP